MIDNSTASFRSRGIAHLWVVAILLASIAGKCWSLVTRREWHGDTLDGIANAIGVPTGSLIVLAIGLDALIVLGLFSTRFRGASAYAAISLAAIGSGLDLWMSRNTEHRGCGCFGPPDQVSSVVVAYLRTAVVLFSIMTTFSQTDERRWPLRSVRIIYGLGVMALIAALAYFLFSTQSSTQPSSSKVGRPQPVLREQPSTRRSSSEAVSASAYRAESGPTAISLRFKVASSLGEPVAAQLDIELCRAGQSVKSRIETCDSTGVAELTLDGENEPGTELVRVMARSTGFGTAFREFIVPVGSMRVEYDIALQRSASLVIRCVSSTGAPIPDAAVAILRGDSTFMDLDAAAQAGSNAVALRSWLDWPKALTDSLGVASFPSLAAGEYRAVISKRGMVFPETVGIYLRPAGQMSKFVLGVPLMHGALQLNHDRREAEDISCEYAMSLASKGGAGFSILNANVLPADVRPTSTDDLRFYCTRRLTPVTGVESDFQKTLASWVDEPIDELKHIPVTVFGPGLPRREIQVAVAPWREGEAPPLTHVEIGQARAWGYAEVTCDFVRENPHTREVNFSFTMVNPPQDTLHRRVKFGGEGIGKFNLPAGTWRIETSDKVGVGVCMPIEPQVFEILAEQSTRIKVEPSRELVCIQFSLPSVSGFSPTRFRLEKDITSPAPKKVVGFFGSSGCTWVHPGTYKWRARAPGLLPEVIEFTASLSSSPHLIKLSPRLNWQN